MKQKHMHDLIEDLHNMNNPQIVVQLPNGNTLSVNDYHHSESEKGEMVIVIQAGRKLKTL